MLFFVVATLVILLMVVMVVVVVVMITQWKFYCKGMIQNFSLCEWFGLCLWGVFGKERRGRVGGAGMGFSKIL